MKLSTTRVDTTSSRLNINGINLILIGVFAFFTSTHLFAAKCPNGTTIAPAAAQTKCQGSAGTVLTATNTESGTGGNPTELYQWYYNTTNSNTIAGATLIVGATTSTYTPPTTTVGIRYYFCVVYAADNGCGQTNTTQSLASNAVQVTVVAPPTTANAGADQSSFCATSTTLAGNAPASGTGTWTCITNCGGVTITTPGSPTSTVTGLTVGVATTFRWTIANSPCASSTDDVIITPKPTTTTSQLFCIDRNATIGDIIITGQNIKWYDSFNNGKLLYKTTFIQNGQNKLPSQKLKCI